MFVVIPVAIVFLLANFVRAFRHQIPLSFFMMGLLDTCVVVDLTNSKARAEHRITGRSTQLRQMLWQVIYKAKCGREDLNVNTPVLLCVLIAGRPVVPKLGRGTRAACSFQLSRAGVATW